VELTVTTDLSSANKYDHELGFALDIDGTLVISHQEIPGCSEALNTLTRNNIPYILVTNNISKSEQTKADELNKLFKLDVPITADQIILNITPLKTYMPWKDKVILIVIRENEAKDRLPFE
jgi:ribonucleotide monophosphatase NagD (HAD superfamily)